MPGKKEVERPEEGHRKVVAQEINDITTLKSVYKEGRDANTTLRVLYGAYIDSPPFCQ